MRRLPRRQAQVVAHHYVDDASVAGIAAVLGWAEGKVKSISHKARLALARSLEGAR